MNTSDKTDPTDANQALDQLRSVLIDGETLEAWAIQRRFYALTHRRLLVAATSGRLISIRRGLLGGFEMQDIRWQDLREVKLSVGIFGADLTVTASRMVDLASASSPPVVLSFQGLRKEQAQQVYRLTQGHEQAWREKRRIRELEELRAQNGGVMISSPTPQPSVPTGSATQQSDAVTRLQQAKQMLDAKLISDSEYQSIKAKILGDV